MFESRNRTVFSFVLTILLAAFTAAARDWSQWRGVNRDGHTQELAIPAALPKTLREEWRATVGVGHSSPVAAEGRVYEFARQGEEEVAMSFDLATGKQLWRASYPVAYKMNEAALAHGKGPKSTPVVSNGRLYTLGITGVLSCFDAKAGKLLWRREFSKDYPATSPLYGTAMSPIVLDGLLIAHVGGQDKGALTAFDAATGTTKWQWAGDGPAYSSPVVATLAGARQLITYTQKSLVGVDPASGRLLWQLPAKTEYDTNSVTPVVYKDTIIYARENQGLTAVRLARQGDQLAPQEVWKNPENELYMNTPVVAGNLLFGLSVKKRGQFFCLDADTGKTLWQSEGRQGENASLVDAGKYLLALTTDSTLYLLPPGAKAFEPSAQYAVARSPVWAHPLVAGEHIVVKDETTLASFSIKN
ncbi:MAG TPA: PQQ-binding-like beta-propeller repeat protein [Pyrinomonadaceae bacterium]|jgi:outer membrane protein assembly factor BamB|nr:PQQ-binding-like beta-propeller repeat protein [Pyrinomonadaceae bacterium]